MVRLRNVTTGVIVSVADDKAGRFGSDYVPADAPSKASPAKTVTPEADRLADLGLDKPAKKPTGKK